MSVSFLEPETNIMDQFLGPETDIMGERKIMVLWFDIKMTVYTTHHPPMRVRSDTEIV